MSIPRAPIRLASLVAALAAVGVLGGTAVARGAPREPGYARQFGHLTMKDRVELG